ncbi:MULTISPECIES: DUF4468 domain-containing protein [Chryseobacterium]|uniref:DUF4468 domain-containing protein n=1 Tax=Chryseobacterium geocarposphaerae TaxID=1416776 RepID=A0ABU1LBF9_9FLAO|nr:MULTISPECIES: DUF4468 domain-containing protein [Chryseobacterium]MDR6404063.1 hypothetical protein [Chryseobacterium geocarposphaerae]MDR6698418.1 hypothetical protein [Chryseobacterium ginsenosidimutans]
MKKLLLIFIVISSFINAQELTLVDGNYKYIKIIGIDKTKNEIYPIIKKWLSDSTSQSQYIIDRDDPQAGILSVHKRLPLISYSTSEATIPSYEVNIEIKDKQVKYTVDNIIFQDIFKGMTNTKNDYQYFLKRIAFSESRIQELNKDPNTEKKKSKKKDISNQVRQ